MSEAVQNNGNKLALYVTELTFHDACVIDILRQRDNALMSEHHVSAGTVHVTYGVCDLSRGDAC